MLELVGINAKDSSSSNKRSPSLDTRDNQPSRKRIKLPISLCRREAPNSASTSNRSCAGTRTNKGGLVDDTQEYPAHRIHVVLNIDDNVAQDPLQAKRQSNTDTHAGLERDILKACTIYVDVWMSHGENTSPLFYDIAKSLGAQVSVCTHSFEILLSTLVRLSRALGHYALILCTHQAFKAPYRSTCMYLLLFRSIAVDAF